MEPIQVDGEVAKIGIRTGYREGHVIEDAKVGWNPESTGPLIPEIAIPETIPYSNGQVILDEAQQDGTFK